MYRYMTNVEAAFRESGYNIGPQTLEALSPLILKFKNAGMTGKQTGIACLEQVKIYSAFERLKEEMNHYKRLNF